MDHLTSSTKEKVEKAKIRDLEWSLAPMSRLLMLTTGIETHLRPGKMYSKCRWLLILFSTLTIVSNVGSFLINYSLNGFLNNQKETPSFERKQYRENEDPSNSKERRWVEIGCSILPILVHLSLYFIQFTKSWRGLWCCIKDIEEQLQLGPTFCRKYRKFVSMACVIPFLECFNSSWGFYFLISGDFTLSLKFFGNIYLILGFLIMNSCASFVSLLVSVVVFACVILAALLFGFLDDLITDIADSGSRSLDLALALDALNEWKRLHFIVTRFVDRINRVLGMITLLVMVRGFINIMVNSYNMATMDTTQKEDHWGLNIFNWSGIFLELFYVSFMIFISSYMNHNIIKMKNNLMRLNTSTHPSIQNMVASALTQVAKKRVCITAAGLFEVGISLYPTLIGTFVSYILLVYERATDKPDEVGAHGSTITAGGKC